MVSGADIPEPPVALEVEVTSKMVKRLMDVELYVYSLTRVVPLETTVVLNVPLARVAVVGMTPVAAPEVEVAEPPVVGVAPGGNSVDPEASTMTDPFVVIV